MTAILVAEDEPRIASFVEKGLRAAGFTTRSVGDGEKALDLAMSGDFDLLVLDLGLPRKDGWDVLRDLRGSGSQLPVVVLTARDSVHDTVTGFELGADDYLAKPFRFEELLVRIRARLRQSSTATSDVVQAGGITLDLKSRKAEVDGRQVELTAREFVLAETLLRHPGQVLSREQLLSAAWGYDFDPGSNVVDVYIRYLRRKLGADRIVTVRGMGYQLRS